MKLVEEGHIDLDAPVSRYLARWQLPESEYDHDEVTVRRLLAHNSGLTDGLGFLGFEPDQTIPSLEQELTDTTDVLPSADGEIRVGAEPGSGWRYSGGGYLILQLMIEDGARESALPAVQMATRLSSFTSTGTRQSDRPSLIRSTVFP
jgi:CubicO group peptidase (beta-lactamase class C family)